MIKLKQRILYYFWSIWPLMSALYLLVFSISFIMYIHRIHYGLLLLFILLVMGIMVLMGGGCDVIREITYQGKHIMIVQRGLKIGFIIFWLIISRFSYNNRHARYCFWWEG